MTIENDKEDMDEWKEILTELQVQNSRFKMATKVENSDGKMESCNGTHHLIRLTYKKVNQVMKKYFHSKKVSKEFNRKYLKRAKNWKDGFQVLVSNGTTM